MLVRRRRATRGLCHLHGRSRAFRTAFGLASAALDSASPEPLPPLSAAPRRLTFSRAGDSWFMTKGPARPRIIPAEVALRDGARTSRRTSSVGKGGRPPRYTAGPRRRGKSKHSHRLGHAWGCGGRGLAHSGPHRADRRTHPHQRRGLDGAADTSGGPRRRPSGVDSAEVTREPYGFNRGEEDPDDNASRPTSSRGPRGGYMKRAFPRECSAASCLPCRLRPSGERYGDSADESRQEGSPVREPSTEHGWDTGKVSDFAEPAHDRNTDAQSRPRNTYGVADLRLKLHSSCHGGRFRAPSSRSRDPI